MNKSDCASGISLCNGYLHFARQPFGGVLYCTILCVSVFSRTLIAVPRACARDTTNNVYSLQLPFKPAQKLAPAGGGGPPPGMPQPPPGMAGAPPPPPPPFQVWRFKTKRGSV